MGTRGSGGGTPEKRDEEGRRACGGRPEPDCAVLSPRCNKEAEERERGGASSALCVREMVVLVGCESWREVGLGGCTRAKALSSLHFKELCRSSGRSGMWGFGPPHTLVSCRLSSSEAPLFGDSEGLP